MLHRSAHTLLHSGQLFIAFTCAARLGAKPGAFCAGSKPEAMWVAAFLDDDSSESETPPSWPDASPPRVEEMLQAKRRRIRSKTSIAVALGGLWTWEARAEQVGAHGVGK
eukprot:15469746-Alexandrium_andersonii.AAC.2